MWFNIKMSIHNVDATTVIGVSAGSPQCTLKEKISAYPAEKLLTYGAIPPEARISVPASITVKADCFPCWRHVLLKFNTGLRTMPANVTGVVMHTTNNLNQIDSIGLYFDNTLVHEITNGAQGVICQKYMDAVLARCDPSIDGGWS